MLHDVDSVTNIVAVIKTKNNKQLKGNVNICNLNQQVRHVLRCQDLNGWILTEVSVLHMSAAITLADYSKNTLTRPWHDSCHLVILPRHQADWLIEQGLMSHQTHYRSYQGRFLQVIRPNQECQSTEGSQLGKLSIHRACRGWQHPYERPDNSHQHGRKAGYTTEIQRSWRGHSKNGLRSLREKKQTGKINVDSRSGSFPREKP